MKPCDKQTERILVTSQGIYSDVSNNRCPRRTQSLLEAVTNRLVCSLVVANLVVGSSGSDPRKQAKCNKSA